MAKRKPWSVTIEGTKPPLTVYERADRDGLYLRWSEGDSHRRPKLKGLDSVRGDHGRVDGRLVTQARALALEQYEAAKEREGAPPVELKVGEGAPITLIRGFAKVLDVPGGKYATERDPQWKTMRRVRNRVLGILDPAMLWSDLWPKHYGVVWRTLARRFADEDDDSTLDWRVAEETVQTFIAASNWLGGDGGVLPSAPQPPKRWRAKLKTDWEAVTGLRPTVNRPRHASEEVDALWAHAPAADPRLYLWMELGGGEHRGGQVLRGTRNDLDLTPGAGEGHGTFTIHGRGRKRGATVFLTPDERAVVDYMLTDGYLSELEAEYQAGTRKNYPLWPGGKLRKGKGVDRGTRMSRTTMLNHFKALEARAGVEHVDRRGWYGVRRKSADRVRQHTTDERVKNASGSWAPGSTVRATVYEDGTDPEVARLAAQVRQQARQPTASGTPAEAGLSRAEALAALQALGVDAEKLQAALTLLGVEDAPDPTSVGDA